MSIKIIGVSKLYLRSYPGTATIEAVKDISIDINEGSRTLFFGPTGSGKTTLLSLIAGIIKPTRGEIVFNNIHISRSRDGAVSLFREQNIGYIPQDTLLIGDLTVIENVLSPNAFFKQSMRHLKKSAYTLLDRLSLARKALYPPFELSGGEIKKVMIARALLKKPRYILADEPISELDQKSSDDVMELFDEHLKDGSAVIIASHRALQMNSDSDIYTLKQGRIIRHAKGGMT